MVIVFWLGILLTIKYWGIYSFPIFKLVGGIISVYFYFRIILKFLNISFITFIKRTLYRIVIPIIIQILFLILIMPYLPDNKNTLNLFSVVIAGGIGALLGFSTLYLTSDYYKMEFNQYSSILNLIQRKIK